MHRDENTCSPPAAAAVASIERAALATLRPRCGTSDTREPITSGTRQTLAARSRICDP